MKGTEQSGRRARPAAATSGVSLLPGIGEHPGFTLWRVSLALVAALFVLGALCVRGLFACVGVTAVVSWCVTWAHPWTAAAAGAEAWALETGFGVHRQGSSASPGRT